MAPAISATQSLGRQGSLHRRWDPLQAVDAGQLGEPQHGCRVAGGMHGRDLLVDSSDDAFALQRRAIAADRDPASAAGGEMVQRVAAEALEAAVAEQDQGVVVTQGRWIVAELEGPHRSRVAAEAAKQKLAEEGTVETGPGPDQEQATGAGEPRPARLDRLGLLKETLELAGLTLKSAQQVFAWFGHSKTLAARASWSRSPGAGAAGSNYISVA